MMHYDLIIVGGGLVGAGLALALPPTLKVALIDARDPSAEDPRLFALSASSCYFLENINVWKALSAHASPIDHVHVSYQGHLGKFCLSKEDVSLESLGHVVPARLLEAALQEKLPHQPNLTLFNQSTLFALRQDDGLYYLSIKKDSLELTLTSRIVIAADGEHSTVRKKLNIYTKTFDYQQSAIVTQTTLSRSHKNSAYERFNAKGAIAMLPLPGNECATIWSIDTGEAANLMELSDTQFLAALQNTFGYRLGRLLSVKKRHLFPLRNVSAQKSEHQGVLLLGNAMHTLHPIAAQGFNLALYEVAKLTEAITEKLAMHSTLTPVDISAISQQMKRQQTISMGLSHKIPQIFSKKSSLIASLISFTMLGLDLLSPLKKKLLENMLARRGCVPRLFMKTTAN